MGNKFPQREVPYRTTEPQGQYVIAYGTLGEGFQIVGPFADYEAAVEWYAESHNRSAEFIPLHRPVIRARMETYNPDLERG